MAIEEGEDTRRYLVVVNDEDQHSIWPEQKALPVGWRAAGMSGTKSECLSWIEGAWKDMTPASLRARQGR